MTVQKVDIVVTSDIDPNEIAQMVQREFENVVHGKSKSLDGAGEMPAKRSRLTLHVDSKATPMGCTIAMTRGGLKYPETFEPGDLMAQAVVVYETAMSMARNGEQPTVRVNTVGTGAALLDLLRTVDGIELWAFGIDEGQ